MNGAELLVHILREQGVTFVATLCGNGLNPFYMAARQAGLRVVDSRNEQAASYLADAYARLTRRVGVCAVSSGIAHVNALSGVVNAYYDGAPMLLISGESATIPTGQGKFQELDQPALAAPVCKMSTRVERVRDLGFLTREALRLAQAGRPGPVHLTVPVDVLEAEVPPEAEEWGRPVVWQRPAVSADPDTVQQAAEWIAAAQSPLLVIGSGVFYAGAGAEVARFLTLTDIPAVTPIWDRGIVDSPLPQFLGVIGAASGEPRLLAESDLLVLLGARTDYRVGYAEPTALRPGARLIRVDVDAQELARGAAADLAVLGDPRAIMAAWNRQWEAQGYARHSAWLAVARQRAGEFRARWRDVPSAPPLTGHHIVEALRPYVAQEAVLLIDGGNIGQWAHMLLAADRYPSHWLTCGASAVVGWGLPGAMAARLAYPDRPVILLSGDGSIGFTIAEFEAATRQGLPFVVVLADDRAWGIVVCGQRQRYGECGVVASCMSAVRYDLVAESFGALGIRVECPEELGPAIARGLAAGRPALIHVPVAPGGPAD